VTAPDWSMEGTKCILLPLLGGGPGGEGEKGFVNGRPIG